MKFAIIEIGSNNTKTHIYENKELIKENNVTIEFKKNYQLTNAIAQEDLLKLYATIEEALKYTDKIYIYGCSIFRTILPAELKSINEGLEAKYGTQIQVVSQADEANYTALGCYGNLVYNKNICIFIGGGGSIELLFVNKGQVINKLYYSFGVVDITKKFPSLKDDIPSTSFDDVYNYIDNLMNDIDTSAEVLILAGGDHIYWYNNANYQLLENTLYKSAYQEFMITKEMSDKYDRDAMRTSLDSIRARSDNPLWFDGSRAMKVITNLVANKIQAKYIIPTRINMEVGLKEQILSSLK